jgi:WD40 repeat protein
MVALAFLLLPVSSSTAQVAHVLRGHTADVTCLAVSPDGSTLASGSADQSVRLWNIQTKQLITTFKGLTSRVNDVSFADRGKLLLSASYDGTVIVWPMEAIKGQKRFSKPLVFTVPREVLHRVPCSPVSTLAISGNRSRFDGEHLWDAGTGKILKSFAPSSHHDGVLAFSPDGKMVAATYDEKIRFLRVPALEPMIELEAKELQSSIHSDSFCFAPDGRTIAFTKHNPREVVVWDLAHKAPILTIPKPAEDIEFSPCGKGLYVVSDGLTAWNTSAPRVAATSARNDSGFNVREKIGALQRQSDTPAQPEPLSPLLSWPEARVEVVPIPGHSLAATVGSSHGWGPDNVILWELATGNLQGLGESHLPNDKNAALRSEASTTISMPEGNFDSIAFLPDGNSVATLNRNAGKIQVWNVADGALAKEFPVLGSNEIPYDGPSNLTSHTDGSVLAAWGWGGATVCDLQTGTRRLLPVRKELWLQRISPLGMYLAARSSPLDISNVRGEELGNSKFELRYDAVGLSRDGRFAAMCVHADGAYRATLIDLSSGKLEPNFIGEEGKYNPIAVSPSGKYIAAVKTVGNDSVCFVWKANSGERVATIVVYGSSILEFLTDDRLLYGLHYSTFSVWDIPSGKQLCALKDTDCSSCKSFTYSPELNVIAIAPHNGSLDLYDAQTGDRLLQREYPYKTLARQVEFSSDGKKLAVRLDAESGSQNPAAVEIWDFQHGGPRNGMYFAGKATRKDAAKIGKLLADRLDLGGATGIQAIVTKAGEIYSLSLALPEGAWEDRQITSEFRRIGGELVAGGFGPKVRLQFCTQRFECKKEILVQDAKLVGK